MGGGGQHADRPGRCVIGDAVQAARLHHLLDQCPRVGAGRVGQLESGQRFGRGADRRLQHVLRLAEIHLLDRRDRRDRVHRPGQGHVGKVDLAIRAVLVEVALALEDRHDAHAVAARPADHHCFAHGQGVGLELAARGQAADITRNRHQHAYGGSVGSPSGSGAHGLQQRHGSAVVDIRPGQSGPAGGDGVISGHGMLWGPSR